MFLLTHLTTRMLVEARSTLGTSLKMTAESEI